MPRRASVNKPELLRQQLLELLTDFESELQKEDLREKVHSLIPVHRRLRDLGCSLVPREAGKAARDRILFYLLKYPLLVVHGEELMVVSGIGEWARRVRELRVQFGWRIISGKTAKEMVQEDAEDFSIPGVDISAMRPEEYVLVDTVQDRETAFRWHRANDIRRSNLSIRDKILQFMKENIGKQLTGEELRYLAGNKTEWARRVRELRTEYGWFVMTKTTGMPELPVGIYVLASDRQAPEHDRTIKDPVRREVLRRDDYRCKDCTWSVKEWNSSDPRHIEAHHVAHHAKGGRNTAENLITLCNICHDVRHSKENKELAASILVGSPD